MNGNENTDRSHSELGKEKDLTSHNSLSGEIMKLKKMLDEGIIDQEEFKKLKKKVIE